jgi:enoyl-CoA hydratase/carnithine racemase
MIAPRSFRWEEKGEIGTITFTRPDTLNSLTFEVYRELTDLFAALQTHDTVKVVVITGQGRGFCSGGDVNSIIGELFKRDARGLIEFTRMTGELIGNIRRLRKPVIAACNGVTAGAGAVIALAADFRVLSESARFAFLFVRVGLAGCDMGAGWLLPRVIGLGRATQLLMLGDTVDAPTAERYGLAYKVVPDDVLSLEVERLAGKLVAGPAFALGMTKTMLDAEHSMSLADALEAEAQAQLICMQTSDFREAYEAFTAKRAPAFRGR